MFKDALYLLEAVYELNEMGFLCSLFEIFGFAIGVPVGLLVGFVLFIYSEPAHVKDPIIKPLHELDSNALHDLLDEIPQWIKNPDYDRVDWLNKFLSDMWPYLDKAICGMIKSTAEPIFADYIGKYQIQSIEFESLTLGTLPPTIYGIKVYETNEKVLVMEPIVRWAGNPNVTVLLKFPFLQMNVQLVDLQIFAAPRVILKPLVPTFPCFASIVVSLMEKPHVDFGMKIFGADLMAIPGFYQYVQETIKKQVASLYQWPQTLEIPVLDSSVAVMEKPVGILHVKVVKAFKLLKKDLLGTSDPYVKFGLSGDRLPMKKTSVKMNNLNPEWNEQFKLTVKEPETQLLQLHVFDWEKVGSHDKLGMQVVPLKLLNPNETKLFRLDLLKSIDPNESQSKKKRGQLVVELAFNPFREGSDECSGCSDGYTRMENGSGGVSEGMALSGAGLLLVVVQGAEDVEGKRHNNPYALVIFRGEERKTKMIKKTRDPCWDEEFHYMLEEAPVNDKIHIEVLSKRTVFGFQFKESLGHVDINLIDVVNNGRINEKYHLINSKNGVIHVEIRWRTI
ncbi:hypothetical protein IFM89_034760 [Coptis chinensis]|uniref:Synaptotagmin-3 n=1 Tax=Coptis chinensis TaxID=261450 RepID=A0A835HAL1_9MAGN|nr:hypothetical protein IFM89_034760 [Coptis chinensis]